MHVYGSPIYWPKLVKEAERQYQGVLRLRPGYAEAHNNYGVFLEKRGESASAEQQYLQALELRQDYAEAHYNYAMLFESVNETKAHEHYRAALQALPSYAEAHNNLAILLSERGDLQRAEEHYLAPCGCGHAILRQTIILLFFA